MLVNDADLEFTFAMYDSAVALLPEKDKSAMAEEVIRHLADFGVDISANATEISDHCEVLEVAVCEYLEQENEDVDMFEEYNEDDEEYDY